MSRTEWSPLPPGTIPAAHKPRYRPSGWQAEQDALREEAEREERERDSVARNDVVRVVR